MKVTIEIWQSRDEKWNCEINTTDNGPKETESWSVENFSTLLYLIADKFPNARCVAEPEEI